MKELSSLSITLGEKIRDIRKTKSLSLNDAAQLTGVSKAMLGQIERFESSPTVDLLWKLSQGFGVNYTELLDTSSEKSVADIHETLNKKMLVSPIFSSKPPAKIEIFDITISPDFEVMREPHKKVLEEYVWVIVGEMDIYFDKKWNRLSENSALRFDANQRHGYRANTRAARFSNTLVYK